MGGLAGALLDVLLGQYIEDDNSARQIELDLLSGNLLLQNIAVRSGALQRALGLPLVIKSGVIGRIQLTIPWSKLGSEPTRLQLDGLLMLVTPQSEADWDAEAEEERNEARKQAALAKRTAAEREKAQAQAQAGKEVKEKQSFLSKLTTQVLDRLQATARGARRQLAMRSSPRMRSARVAARVPRPGCCVSMWFRRQRAAAFAPLVAPCACHSSARVLARWT